MPFTRLDQEQALLFSELRFQTLFRNIPAMAVTLDANWTILSANSSCTSQLGYTIDELEGQSVLNLFFGEDRTAVAEELRRCLENPNQVHRWQFRKVRKDGELMWVEEAAQAVSDQNGTLNVLVVCQDVSERKQLETEIQDARNYTENIVETVIEPLVVLNSDLKVLTANHSFYNTFKVTPEETIGNYIYDLGNRQWDIPKLRVLLEEILPHDTVFNGYEVEHDFLDIGHKIIMLNARQVFRENIGSHIILLAMEDITERKRAEDALRKSAAELEESKRLSDALNEIDTVLFSTKDYDVIMDRMLQLSTEAIGAETGVIFSKEGDWWTVRYEYKLPLSLIGQAFRNTEVMHTAITAETKRSLVIQDALNSPGIDQKFVEMLGIRSLLDFPLIVKGEVIGDLTFHYHSSPVPFNERQVEFVRKLQISISLALENNKLLNTSKQSESKLKEAEKLGKFGHFNYDVHTRKITWSEGMFHIFGRDPVLGEPTVEEFYELYSVDQGPEKMRELIGDKETAEFDAKIKCGDLAFFSHFVIRSVKDDKGDVVSIFGTIQDITERKQVEDALRESEERFRATFNQTAVGICHMMPDGHWMLINQKLCDVVGYSEQELKALTLKDITHPDDHEISMRQFELLLGGELENYTLEKRLIRKDGSTVWINLSASMVSDASDNPRFVVGVIEDITKRKQAEAEIKLAGKEIEILNTDLAARAAELEAANNELGTFNYTVAHDLRQPLNLVGMCCQSIKLLCGDQLKEECMAYVQDAYNATMGMDRLIGALLNFSRMGHVEPQREMVDLGKLAHEVAQSLKLIEPERQVDFRIADGIVANGDANLLRVVLDNLLGNAWKYSSMIEKAVIEFGVRDIGGGLTYFIRDNGAGFDIMDADKLFAPFHRLPGAETSKGFGIGLATVARIIQRHGGKVWAEGETDKGATFYFTISAG